MFYPFLIKYLKYEEMFFSNSIVHVCVNSQCARMGWNY